MFLTNLYEQEYPAFQAQLEQTKKRLSGPSRKVLPVKGQFKATISSGDLTVEEEIFVVRRLSKPLLGRPAIESLDLLHRVNTIESKDKLKKQFYKLFNGLGKLEGEYRIQLGADSKPFALATPRRVVIPMLPKVKAELERMERLGVVRCVQDLAYRLVLGDGSCTEAGGKGSDMCGPDSPE